MPVRRNFFTNLFGFPNPEPAQKILQYEFDNLCEPTNSTPAPVPPRQITWSLLKSCATGVCAVFGMLVSLIRLLTTAPFIWSCRLIRHRRLVSAAYKVRSTKFRRRTTSRHRAKRLPISIWNAILTFQLVLASSCTLTRTSQGLSAQLLPFSLTSTRGSEVANGNSSTTKSSPEEIRTRGVQKIQIQGQNGRTETNTGAATGPR